jgi:polysaccharide export outer membrane protein
MKLLKFFIPFCGLTTFLLSCKTYEKMVLFHAGMSDSTKLYHNYTPTIKTDDFLSINITCDDIESAAPFNFPFGNVQNINNGYLIGNPALFGYLVNEKGEVKLPVLGNIKLADLTRMQATEILEKKLQEYLKNPIVNIQIQNYKITVLGEVKTPGTFKIPNERITLLEAIGLAGDLKPTGVRKNILVIREMNGKKMEYRVDLTQKNLFSSPVFYLTQNDVVYIQPNPTARYESTLIGRTASVFISVASLILSTLILITRS